MSCSVILRLIGSSEDQSDWKDNLKRQKFALEKISLKAILQNKVVVCVALDCLTKG